MKSVSGFTGVPLLNEVLDIGLHVIDLCEVHESLSWLQLLTKLAQGVNEVQERVSALRNRVAEFLLVATKFMKNRQIADKTESFLQELSTDIESDLIDLKMCVNLFLQIICDPNYFLRCLDTINEHLQRIRDQNIVLTTLLPESNISQIEHCETLFQDAIDRFQVDFLLIRYIFTHRNPIDATCSTCCRRPWKDTGPTGTDTRRNTGSIPEGRSTTKFGR